MRFCPKCGNKYDPYEDTFCAKCGTIFHKVKKRESGGWGLVLLLVGFVAISPFIFKLLFGDCGTFRVAWGIRTYETYAIHLAELEYASRNGDVRPPPHLFVQVDKDREEMEVVYDKCLFPPSSALYDTLVYASEYFNYLPLNGQEKNSRVYEAQRRYEASLKKYENEIEILKACHPFCNIEADFDIKNSIEYLPPRSPTPRPRPTSTNRPASNSKPTERPTEMPFRPKYPYIVGMLNGGQIDMKIQVILNDWLTASLPANTYYWFVSNIETKADGTMIIELVGMRIPVEEWQKYSDVYPIAGSEIVWRGSVVVHGNSVEIYTP